MTPWRHSRPVDLIETLDPQREVLVSHVHLSPRGNLLVARALADEVIKELCPEPGAMHRLDSEYEALETPER